MINDLLIFLPACLALNLAFGPNNLLAMNHGMENGLPFAFKASLGRILVFIPMISLSGLGLGLMLATSPLIFTGVKTIGAAYLVWIGIKLLKLLKPIIDGSEKKKARSMSFAFRSEAIIAAGNPKAILIFAAFFPQFVDQNNYAWSYLALSAAFLSLEMIAILIYASIGCFAANVDLLKVHWLQRASGVSMIFFGVLLFFL